MAQKFLYSAINQSPDLVESSASVTIHNAVLVRSSDVDIADEVDVRCCWCGHLMLLTLLLKLMSGAAGAVI